MVVQVIGFEDGTVSIIEVNVTREDPTMPNFVFRCIWTVTLPFTVFHVEYGHFFGNGGQDLDNTQDVVIHTNQLFVITERSVHLFSPR